MKGVSVSAPRFDNHHSGLGVSNPTPRISWSFTQLSDTYKGWKQQSYDLQVQFEDEKDTQSFSIYSPNSIYVPWPARPLKSREIARVRVRCYGTTDSTRDAPEPTQWSPWSEVEVALLEASDWSAQWIAAPKQEKNEDGSLRPIRLAAQFDLPANCSVKRARLYITSRGCYDAYIDARPVGDQCMAPGWQSYRHRLHYQTFDVTTLLLQGLGDGKHTIDVHVAAGWYASALAWAGGRRCFFGNELSLVAQLMVEFDDQSAAFVLTSDDNWKSIYGPISSSEIYKGETYDMALASIPDLQTSDSRTAALVRVVNPPSSKLISPDAPPVRVTQEIQPIKIFRSSSGKVLIDFGQNLVGRLLIKSLTKPSSTKVSFSHAEVLEDDELGRRPLRHALSTDIVVCDGNELINWTPKFTFHGFRYIEVTGWAPEDVSCPLTSDSLVAQVLHTDMRRTGHFECSNSLINKLHDNAIWSMRGNFLSIPTDCPQRDERLGWTGDIQVFAPSATFLYDTTGMLGNWLDDLAAEQLSLEHNCVPPFVVPDVITKFYAKDDDFWPAVPNAVWDDVAVLLPWALYTASGDVNLLRKQYESMKAWLDRGVRRGEDKLWDPELYQLGDWLDPIAPPSEPGNGRTDGTLVADAYLVRVTQKMAEACKVLEISSDAQKYTEEYEALLETFREKYMTKKGLIVGDTQTALALGIMFNLFETADQRQHAGDRLARSVRMQQFRVATGFAGTPVVLHALTAVGHHQLAYRMLLEQRCPSWMYAVLMGGTTIWERWDSMLPDGRINPGEMTSFNHYALGSVVNWLHESVGGISPLEPGWKKILVRPVPGGQLTHAEVTYDSPYGKIECTWRLEPHNTFKMSLQVPPNTTAYAILPSHQRKNLDGERGDGTWVGSGHHTFECTFTTEAWPPEAIMPPFWPQPKPICS